MTLTRDQIINTIRAEVEPLDYVYAMWEGGAAAFNRVDEWSDIDLQIDAEDSHTDNVIAAVEKALTSLSPIDLRWRLPEPTWHGHSQVFYRLRDASPFLLIDCAFIHHSLPEKFLQPEIHGNAIVHFDKQGITQIKPLDSDQWRATLLTTLRSRLDTLKVMFDLFQILTIKELNRNNHLEAFAFYQNYTLRPLVEALSIKYRPSRYNFNTRYLHYDLPDDIIRTLESLYFVGSADEIRVKREQAERLFYDTLASIDLESISI